MWRLTKYGLAFAAGQAFQVIAERERFRRQVEETFELLQVMNRARIDVLRKLKDDDQ